MEFNVDRAFSKLVYELNQFSTKYYSPDLEIFGLNYKTIKIRENLPMILEYARTVLEYMKNKYKTYDIHENYNFLKHADIMQEQLDILEPFSNRIIKGKEFKFSYNSKFMKIIEENNLSDKIYEEIVAEINGTYNDHYFTSMYIMVRKLLENLLYDCLKKYYGTDVNKYFNTAKNQHQGYGTLINNFNKMIEETRFKRDIGNIEKRFIELLKEFQEKGNKDAHSLFNLPHQDFIEERKDKINNMIKKLDWVLQKL